MSHCFCHSIIYSVLVHLNTSFIIANKNLGFQWDFAIVWAECNRVFTAVYFAIQGSAIEWRLVLDISVCKCMPVAW